MLLFRSCVLAALGGLLGFGPAAPARAGDTIYTYTKIDPPGAVNTYIAGISTGGEVAGSYADAASVLRGFTWSHGVFSSFDAPPGTVNVSVGAISDSGAVAFTAWNDAQKIWQGFIRGPDGVSRVVTHLAGASVDLVSLNRFDAGTGTIGLPGQSTYHGYIDTAGRGFTQFDPPGATETDPAYINGHGSVVGFYVDAGRNVHGFSRIGDTIAPFDAPGALRTAGTFIDPTDHIIAGYYEILPSVPIGFVMNGKHFRSFRFPRAAWTSVNWVMPGGQVIGNWQDQHGASHGFIWSGKRFHTISPYQGAVKIRAYTERVIGANSAGQVVGTYQGSGGTFRGFLGTCKVATCD